MKKTVTDVPLVSLLERAAEERPDAEALVQGVSRYGWRDLREQAHQRAAQLDGIGAPVAIVARGDATTPAWVWAALLGEVPFTVVDPHLPTAQVEQILQDLGAAAVVDSDRLEPRSAPPVANPLAAASILYTSGSRGRPKGVAMSETAMAAAVRSISSYLRLEATDRVWGGLPLHYGYGLYQIFLCAAAGATLVLPASTALVGYTLELLAMQHVTMLPGVPSLWGQLLAAENFDSAHLPDLRQLTNAGDRFPVASIRALRDRFPRLRLHAMYGLTEYTRVCSLDPGEIDEFPESVGTPIAGCEAQIVDANGCPVEGSATGELVVRGEHLFLGYWGQPARSAKSLRPIQRDTRPWLWTGDQFRQDEAGRFYHQGRIDDVFKCRGQKVAPRRVTRVLEDFPTVMEAVVLPQRGEDGSTRVRALVRCTGDLDTRGLVAFCRRHLSSHEVPTIFETVREFPRTPRGKIDHAALTRLTSSEVPFHVPE